MAPSIVLDGHGSALREFGDPGRARTYDLPLRSSRILAAQYVSGLSEIACASTKSSVNSCAVSFLPRTQFPSRCCKIL